ncbi:hypothetical protein K440DRAFT_555694, partial [Wilcoxina mikolae CBS 423.85]
METYASQNQSEAAGWKKRALDTVSQLFHFVQYEDWDICSLYLPHALTAVRYSSESELMAAKLLHNIGIYLYWKGEYDAAEGHLTRSYEIERSISSDILKVTYSLAMVYERKGDYNKALDWYGRALAGDEKSLGKDHPTTLNTVDNIASVYSSQGDYSRALNWCERALAGKEKSLGKDHPSTLTTVYNMALV